MANDAGRMGEPPDLHDHDRQVGRAIMKGILLGMPVSLVGLTIALVVFTHRDLGEAIATAVLPGVLIGVFFGGFVGIARTMTQ